jgi:regulator of replication initiation timing
MFIEVTPAPCATCNSVTAPHYGRPPAEGGGGQICVSCLSKLGEKFGWVPLLRYEEMRATLRDTVAKHDASIARAESAEQRAATAEQELENLRGELASTVASNRNLTADNAEIRRELDAARSDAPRHAYVAELFGRQQAAKTTTTKAKAIA